MNLEFQKSPNKFSRKIALYTKKVMRMNTPVIEFRYPMMTMLLSTTRKSVPVSSCENDETVVRGYRFSATNSQKKNKRHLKGLVSSPDLKSAP
jgi:hypothetical protein